MAKYIDNQGVTCHAMTRAQLESLYKSLDNFITDLTTGEYASNEQSFARVKAAIHQRMREADE